MWVHQVLAADSRVAVVLAMKDGSCSSGNECSVCILSGNLGSHQHSAFSSIAMIAMIAMIISSMLLSIRNSQMVDQWVISNQLNMPLRSFPIVPIHSRLYFISLANLSNVHSRCIFFCDIDMGHLWSIWFNF